MADVAIFDAILSEIAQVRYRVWRTGSFPRISLNGLYVREVEWGAWVRRVWTKVCRSSDEWRLNAESG